MTNTITVDGYLTKRFDNELKASASGSKYLRFYMALTGSKQGEPSTFVNITLFGKSAEYFDAFNQKGNYCIVSGSLKGKFDDNGKQIGFEITGNQVSLITPASKGNNQEQAPKQEKPQVVSNSISDEELPF